MVEVLLQKYKNPFQTLENRDCCGDPDQSVCREDCSNIIWLCVSKKDQGNQCDLVNFQINTDPVTDNEDFDRTDNRFKNPFTIPLPKDFKGVSEALI